MRDLIQQAQLDTHYCATTLKRILFYHSYYEKNLIFKLKTIVSSFTSVSFLSSFAVSDLEQRLAEGLSASSTFSLSSSLDSQLPSLISLFIFVWSISETAVVSLYMGGLIVWRPSAQPKLAADHVSLWISPPLYMRMNLQCELGRCVHHIGGGVHFYVNLGQNCLHQNWGKCISRET